MSESAPPTGRLFARPSRLGPASIVDALRTETLGGVLMLFAAVVAVGWANSPWSAGYEALGGLTVGPSALHLDLTLRTWSADGLLAIFFFVAGLELKRELVTGSLRDPTQALVPVAAAIGGIAVPALVFVGVVAAAGGDASRLGGWAIPTATDIAFALAVLAVIQSHCPSQLRVFLLTLAVVDDLCAIVIIGVFYTASIEFLALLGAALLLAVYAVLQRRHIRAWWLYLPIALTTWGLVHEAGVHATIAGMALALLTRARTRENEAVAPAERLQHRIEPLSAGIAVPVFALFAAGVPASAEALRAMIAEPAALGVILGLVVGKPVGVFLGAYLLARLTHAQLDDELSWADIAAVGTLAGVGFTVSLLIGELAYDDPAVTASVKAAVLVGSALAAVAASVMLTRRDAVYRRLAEDDAGQSAVADGSPGP